jgi:ABC-type glycerol-3-phosphate transport system permease component
MATPTAATFPGTRPVEATAQRTSRPRRKAGTIALYLVLGILAIVYFVPLYWVITASFKETAELVRVPPTWWPQSFTLEHHLRVWSTTKFVTYFINSFIYSGGTTLIVTLTSSLIAFVLVKHPSTYGNILFALIVATMMVPMVIYIVPLHALLVFIQQDLGIPMLNTYWGMILPWVLYPFGIFLLRQAMFSVPDDLIDAARIDGASTLRIFWDVVLPLLRSNLMALAILVFIFRYNDLLWPLVVATTSAMYPVTLGLVEYVGMYFTEYGQFTAAAVVVILPILILYLVLQRHIIEGVALTGMKG